MGLNLLLLLLLLQVLGRAGVPGGGAAAVLVAAAFGAGTYQQVPAVVRRGPAAFAAVPNPGGPLVPAPVMLLSGALRAVVVRAAAVASTHGRPQTHAPFEVGMRVG